MLTVKQLIAHLKQFDPDVPVILIDADTWDQLDVPNTGNVRFLDKSQVMIHSLNTREYYTGPAVGIGKAYGHDGWPGEEPDYR